VGRTRGTRDQCPGLLADGQPCSSSSSSSPPFPSSSVFACCAGPRLERGADEKHVPGLTLAWLVLQGQFSEPKSMELRALLGPYPAPANVWGDGDNVITLKY